MSDTERLHLQTGGAELEPEADQVDSPAVDVTEPEIAAIRTESSPSPADRNPLTAAGGAPVDRMTVSLLEDSLAVQMDTQFPSNSQEGRDESPTGVLPFPEDEVFTSSPLQSVARGEETDIHNITNEESHTKEDPPTKLEREEGIATHVEEAASPRSLQTAHYDPMWAVTQMEARQDAKYHLMTRRRQEELRAKEIQLERALNEIRAREVALAATERAHASLLLFDETVSRREQEVIDAESKLHQRTADVQRREQEVGRQVKEQERKYTSLTAPLAAREQELTRRTDDVAAKEADLEHRIHIHMRKMANDEETLATKERAARDLENRARDQLQGLDRRTQELDQLNTHLQKKQKLLRNEEQEVDNRERELSLREQQATQTEARLATSTEAVEARESKSITALAEVQAAAAALEVRTSALNAWEQRLSAEAGKLVDAEKDIQFNRGELEEREAFSAKGMREAATVLEEARATKSEAARELQEAQRIRQEADQLKAAVKRQQGLLEAKLKTLHQRETAIKLAKYDLEQRQQRFPLLRSQYLSAIGVNGTQTHKVGTPHQEERHQRSAANIYASRVIRAVPLANELSDGRRGVTKSKHALSRTLPPLGTGIGAYDSPLPSVQSGRPRLTPIGSSSDASGLAHLALSHKPPRVQPTQASPPRAATPQEPTPVSWSSVTTPSSCRFSSSTLPSSRSSSLASSEVDAHRRRVADQRGRRRDAKSDSKQARFRKRRAMQVAKVEASGDSPSNVIAVKRSEVSNALAAASPPSDDAAFAAAAQRAAEMRSKEQVCDALAARLHEHLQGIIDGRESNEVASPQKPNDDDISWEASPKAPKPQRQSLLQSNSNGHGVSAYRALSDDQVRELFSAHSSQDDAKTEYDFLLYRVVAQDPSLKAAEGSPTQGQSAALVHRLATIQILLEQAASSSRDPSASLTASFATATLLAVQGRLRDLLTYRMDLLEEALSMLEAAMTGG